VDAGKLPNDTLARLLALVQPRDPRVLIGPGIGRDAAVIDTGGPKLLVATSDPITFAADEIGWYAVHVNANDIACTGARPSWFLATVLLPKGATEDTAGAILNQILKACDELEIELVGGHTEVTLGLDRPIVSGTMLGEVERGRLVQPIKARPGDALILTKGIAIEGTGVLAREASARLQSLGVPLTAIEAAKRYIVEPGISVLKEAAAACEAVSVHAMHDPTEGGLATALHELAEASGTGMAIQSDAIEVLPLTRVLCDAAGLNPLGLLSSGALLLAVAANDCERAIEAIEAAGVSARRIGSLASPERGVIMEAGNAPINIPRFARDEVARFLTENRDKP